METVQSDVSDISLVTPLSKKNYMVQLQHQETTEKSFWALQTYFLKY
jgi:hypothetical protein